MTMVDRPTTRLPTMGRAMQAILKTRGTITAPTGTYPLGNQSKLIDGLIKILKLAENTFGPLKSIFLPSHLVGRTEQFDYGICYGLASLRMVFSEEGRLDEFEQRIHALEELSEKSPIVILAEIANPWSGNKAFLTELLTAQDIRALTPGGDETDQVDFSRQSQHLPQLTSISFSGHQNVVGEALFDDKVMPKGHYGILRLTLLGERDAPELDLHALQVEKDANGRLTIYDPNQRVTTFPLQQRSINFWKPIGSRGPDSIEIA